MEIATQALGLLDPAETVSLPSLLSFIVEAASHSFDNPSLVLAYHYTRCFNEDIH